MASSSHIVSVSTAKGTKHSLQPLQWISELYFHIFRPQSHSYEHLWHFGCLDIFKMKLFSQWDSKWFTQKPLNGSFSNILAYWTGVYLFQSEIFAQWLSAAALKPLWCFVQTLPAVLHASFPLTWHSLHLLNNWWKHIVVKNVYHSVLMGIAIKGEGQKYVILHQKQHNCTPQRGLTRDCETCALEKLFGFFQIFLLLLSSFHVCMKTRGQALLSNQHKFEIQQSQ